MIKLRSLNLIYRKLDKNLTGQLVHHYYVQYDKIMRIAGGTLLGHMEGFSQCSTYADLISWLQVLLFNV